MIKSSNITTIDIEKIAEKVHAAWSEGRLRDGWTYGKVRNDELKTTPCLVPYDELSENEKEYDRTTAKTVINALVESGFEIVKK